MKIANLVAAASKTAQNKRELEILVKTWGTLGREQGADPDYVSAFDRAVAEIQRAPTMEAAVAAVERAEGEL